MKNLKTLTILLFFCFTANMNAQFLKRIVKRASEVAQETLKRKTEEKSERTASDAFDSVFNSDRLSKKERSKLNDQPGGQMDSIYENPANRVDDTQNPENAPYATTTQFDFEPGTQPIFGDDFSADGLGDFPAHWDTNGSGEVVEIAGEKWMRLANASLYLPIIEKKLPENYSISFDLMTSGLNNKTSSQAFLKLIVSDDPSFNFGKNWSFVELSPCQFIASPGFVEKWVNGERELRNAMGKDYRPAINGKSRISIAVNKTRMRVWLNENKIVDVPRLVPVGAAYFKLQTVGLRDARDQDELFITNFKMAESGTDKRSKLLTEGKLSTNAILFKSGSAEISSGADEVLQEVAQALQMVPDMTILIVGHTDSDGDGDTNVALSRKRAETIKMSLVTNYDIKYSRITAEGQGENEPIADNSTEAGKTQNRRVEFIKQ